MTGTILNLVAIIIGSSIGMLIGKQFPDRIRQTVIAGMGLFTLVYGFQLFLKTQNSLLVISSIVIGAFLGEWWQIENWLHRLGKLLETRFSPTGEDSGKFSKGFLTASLIFCIGPMTILGSIQNGLTGDFNLLAVKSILDGFYSILLSATLGLGVMFSGVVVLVVQGGISLAAWQIQSITTPAMMNEMSAAGGIILTGIAISSLLEIRQIRAGNMLPALVIAPLLTAIFTKLGYL